MREGTDARIAPSSMRVIAGPDAGLVLELPAPPARLLIGRAEQADLRLTDAEVSRDAAELEIDLTAFSCAT